ncbi:MFS transporter [Ktedonosporobacter rubrisoli]|uniref:MFS transporter n=1 Tax=Ktedonosporobacter rubrisoli TaxID=2509675 RepID=A0A4P6JU64_KTERU|nr:MFS transporter [Ktedonosporobacter rubrisoli]QBD79147.1 MFS transporter [Ktedonosporobacter rubrisoli]
MASQAEESSGHQQPPRLAVPLWQNRSYLLLAGGQAISEVGTHVSDLAYILLILALTHSPAQVGLVGVLELLPVLLLSLHAGALIDRWDRKRVMIFCDAGRAFCLLSIVVTFAWGHLTIFQIYLVALIESTLSVFFDLAERACLRNVVPREQLSEASAQNQTITYVSALVGPPVSGALYGVGQAFPFLTDALSYVASVLSLLWIKVPFQQQRQPASRALWKDIKEGFRWLNSQPLLRLMTLMIGALNLTAIGMNLIVVVLAQQLHATAFATGLILAIGSIGGILGGMLGPFFAKRFRYGMVISLICWLTALILPLFALASNLLILTLVLTLYLIWGRIMGVINFTYRTVLTPDEMQGRVLGIASLIVRGSLPIGMALTGVLLQHFGGTMTVLIFAAYRLLVALIVTLNSHVRNAPRLAELPSSS